MSNGQTYTFFNRRELIRARKKELMGKIAVLNFKKIGEKR